NGPSSRAIPDARNTLPTCMSNLGYQTAAIGKMHFTPQRARHGFQEMILPEDYYRHMARRGYDVQPMHHGLGQNELYPGMATVPEALTLTSWTAEQCVEYIRERRDPTLPFFLWCSFSKPHPPIDPPEPYYSMYRDCDIPTPVFGDWSEGEDVPYAFRLMREKQSFDLVPPEVIREARAAYYGVITQIDYNMGRVFAALQDMGIFDDTLIIYTSDHGEYLGDHCAGGKGFFHEPSAHVPFALRMPQGWDNRQHGTRNRSLVTLADILPTAVTAAGGAPPSDVDGLDLVALARGEIEPRTHLESALGGPDRPGNYAITDGRWKYIWFPVGGSEQLFDLENDPQELHNISSAEVASPHLERLRTELIARHQARGSSAVEEGNWVTLPVPAETEADRRNTSWPGYHTEFYHIDVRH
ncbi:MAG: sulfatase-like hydrolase/transferase, partial [Caldilineaceae bacterium SB0670_bin_27]|nr:sulfatase-like hydrolase/transferase [Caldilineaceae bacterium SB0670_bin_27]